MDKNELTMRFIIIFIFFISSLKIIGQEFHTVFKYEGSNKDITIQNSFPKGGLTYTAPNGEEYIYVIFWTSIINDGNSDLELSIDFPTKPFTVPSSPNVKFNLYVPNEEMTFKKVSLFNYGLDLESYLNKNLGRQSKYVKTIITRYLQSQISRWMTTGRYLRILSCISMRV